MVAVFDADRSAVLYKNAVNEAAVRTSRFSFSSAGCRKATAEAAPLLTADRGLDRAHTALS